MNLRWRRLRLRHIHISDYEDVEAGIVKVADVCDRGLRSRDAVAPRARSRNTFLNVADPYG